MSGAERREHVRQRVSRVEVRVASRESLQASYLRDLSLGGLFVRSKHPLPTASEVVVELSVAGQAATRLRGVVVRHETSEDGTPRGFGVQFSTVDAETQSALEQLISEHQPPEPTSEAGNEMELAELRGTIEAYEESMALLRESEMSLAQKVEESEAERGVLEHVAQELQSRVATFEQTGSELARLQQELAQQRRENQNIGAELASLRDASTKLHDELANAHSAEIELEATRDVADKLREELETANAAAAELELLRGELANAHAAKAELKVTREALARLNDELRTARRADGELKALKDTAHALRTELNHARAAEADFKRLAAELEIQSARSAETQAQLQAEIQALQALVEGSDNGALRRELQELSAQLDDERLKSMALERALQRFSQMGGVVPPRG